MNITLHMSRPQRALYPMAIQPFTRHGNSYTEKSNWTMGGAEQWAVLNNGRWVQALFNNRKSMLKAQNNSSACSEKRHTVSPGCKKNQRSDQIPLGDLFYPPTVANRGPRFLYIYHAFESLFCANWLSRYYRNRRPLGALFYPPTVASRGPRFLYIHHAFESLFCANWLSRYCRNRRPLGALFYLPTVANRGSGFLYIHHAF